MSMSISSVTESKLEKAVAAILESHTEPGRTIAGVLRDLFHGGCAFGTISDLVDVDTTIAFYEQHKKEINRMFRDFDMAPADLQGWMDDDPLALEYTNQIALAWFGFEAAAHALAGRLSLEY